MFLPAFVCLSLLARLLKTRGGIWMKCCVSTDVGTWTNWWTFEPDPDHSQDAGTGLLSPISYKPCYAELRPENLTYTHCRSAAAARRGFKMLLFTEPSEHLCRRYMRSTECPSSMFNPFVRHSFVTEVVDTIFWKRMNWFWYKSAQVVDGAKLWNDQLWRSEGQRSGSQEAED